MSLAECEYVERASLPLPLLHETYTLSLVEAQGENPGAERLSISFGGRQGDLGLGKVNFGQISVSQDRKRLEQIVKREPRSWSFPANRGLLARLKSVRPVLGFPVAHHKEPQ